MPKVLIWKLLQELSDGEDELEILPSGQDEEEIIIELPDHGGFIFFTCVQFCLLVFGVGPKSINIFIYYNNEEG